MLRIQPKIFQIFLLLNLLYLQVSLRAVSRKIKSNLFVRRSFWRIVELPSLSGSDSIENPKSELFKQGGKNIAELDANAILFFHEFLKKMI